MIKRALFVAFSFFSVITARAQFSQDVGPAQSELPSTSLEGDAQNNYSVDLFTGVASVNIPIYKNIINGLDLGVGLSYTCKGIQVDQIASSCGLGWDLAANSYITRTVNDMEDEVTLNSDINHHQYRGVWVDSENTFWNPDTGRIYEHEYDKFHAVIAGRSFDFIMKRVDVYNPALGYYVTQYSAYTYPKSNIQIQLLLDGSVTGGLDTLVGKSENSHIISFNITDEKGNLFEFERGDYEFKNCYDQTSGNVRFVYYPTTKWVVKRITTSTGSVINYSYKTYNVSYPLYVNEIGWEVNNHDTSWDEDTYISSSPVFWGGVLSHISSIQYPNGDSVIFQLGDPNGVSRLDVGNDDILNAIVVKNGYDNNCFNLIKFQFFYSYFNTPIPSCSFSPFRRNYVPYYPTTGTDYISSLESAGFSHDSAVHQVQYGLRLKLNAIYKFAVDNSNELYYSFTYSDTALPLRFSASQDWYGYFNNEAPQTFNVDGPLPLSSAPLHKLTFHIPTYYGDFRFTGNYGVDKTPDINYLKAFTLNSITNSMGGRTNFYYKAHSLADPSVNTHPLGSTSLGPNTYDGLCIDSILYLDGFSSDNNVSLHYNFTNGLILNPEGNYWYVHEWAQDMPGIGSRYVTNKLIYPIDLYHGSNHGYSNASVHKIGFNGESLSYIQYQFSNIVDQTNTYNFLDDDKTSWYTYSFPRTSINDYHLGLPLNIATYQEPSGNPISSATYTYDTSIGTMPPNSTAYFFYNNIHDNKSIQQSYNRTYQPFFPARMRVKSQSITRFSGPDAYVITNNFTYDANDNITSLKSTDSRGRSIIKYIGYNTSYDPYNYPSLTSNLLPGNHFSQDLITVETDDITDPANPKVLSFSQKIPNYSSGKFLIDSIANATIDSPVLVSKFHNLDTNNFYYNKYVTDITRFTKRDDHNNVVEYWNNNVYRSAIWDTRIGQKMANVYNAKYKDVAFTSFEGTFASLGTQDYNKGNWDFNPSYIVYPVSGTMALTGKYYYKLNPSPISNIITTVNTLTSGTQYLITFWASSTPIVKNGTSNVIVQPMETVGTWTFYTGTTRGVGNNITIQAASGMVTNIDELRLHPVDATMSTYTYEPLFGLSSQCDARNNVLYYLYDPLGKLKVVKDIQGNVISYKRQIVQGADY